MMKSERFRASPAQRKTFRQCVAGLYTVFSLGAMYNLGAVIAPLHLASTGLLYSMMKYDVLSCVVAARP